MTAVWFTITAYHLRYLVSPHPVRLSVWDTRT